MHDSGTMAMLSSVTNLYQLLTFADVLQDISNKDTEIMNTMRQQKADLEAAKADLETAKADLEDQQTQLENQKSTMQSKQNELTSDLVQAGQDLADAKAAAADAQALVDSDQMNYEAVQDAITELLKSAESAHADLKFNGVFACPLSSYSRISSTFGTRTLNGVTKLHPGVDFAAPAGTTINAAADGHRPGGQQRIFHGQPSASGAVAGQQRVEQHRQQGDPHQPAERHPGLSAAPFGKERDILWIMIRGTGGWSASAA
jgi:murein DD-endopeptidase MepM/ murein hydrolase activator NlpD